MENDYNEIKIAYYKRRVSELEYRMKKAETVEDMEKIYLDLAPLQKFLEGLDS